MTNAIVLLESHHRKKWGTGGKVFPVRYRTGETTPDWPGTDYVFVGDEDGLPPLETWVLQETYTSRREVFCWLMEFAGLDESHPKIWDRLAGEMRTRVYRVSDKGVPLGGAQSSASSSW
jgi:hypothetical protein